jgi:membrane protease YdiL (CAAX protease family)
MQEPPVQFDLSAEKVDAPLPRMPWVWVIFAFLFGFVIVSSLLTHDKKSAINEDSSKTKEKALELQICTRSMVKDAGGDRKDHMFDQQIEELLERSKKDPSAQKLRIVLRVEDNLAPFRDDIANLAKSSKPEDQAFAKLYTEPKPKKEESLALLKQVDGSELSERLATVQVKEGFGDKTIRLKTFDPSRAVGIGIVAMLGVVGLGIGMLLWYLYGYQRQLGRLIPKGLSLGNIDPGRADRLVFVALVVISTYFVSGTAMALLVKNSSFGAQLMVYLPIFAVIGICLSIPIFGWRITPKSIGLSFEKFPEKLGWAFGAFFANIPIMLVLIVITAGLQKVLPGGGHPVSEELMNNPKPGEIVQIAFLACVIAPIWEEIFFRGLLFPAFAKVFGKPIYGALLSSFIFASIHPQGALGVPVLMTVALMLCAVSYQTKSLVSNMMLHALHNGATLAAALVLIPLFK